MATAVEQERLVEVEADESVGGGRRVVGEEKTFRGYDPDQVLLMAPVLAEWVPEGDLAHFVSDLVESGTLDLGAIYGKRRTTGMRKGMKESYIEVLATHGGPDHALATREGAAKRWTGVHAGRLLSPEMPLSGVPTRS